MAHQQRRHRNRAERDAIRCEVETKAAETGMFAADGFEVFMDVLDQFVAAVDARGPKGSGHTFEGLVPLPGLRGDEHAQVEYCLPGRRIVPHFVRIGRCRGRL
jgi:hypothetical protein